MSKRSSQTRDGGDDKAGDHADAVAREAARLLAQHKAADMREALRLANESIKPASPHASKDDRHHAPSPGRVRQHAQAMSMQAMGEAAYRGQHVRWLTIAEELMTTIEQALPDADTLLVGRAAEQGRWGGGHFDADPALHIRVHCAESITELVQALEPFGYDDPEMKFITLDGRSGRLSQVQWVEEGVRIVLTRCPQRSVFDDHHDLVTGKATATLDVRQLRARLTPNP